MITLTLHDEDALEVLAAINVVGSRTEPNAKLDRARDAFRCALLLCDCGEPKPAQP